MGKSRDVTSAPSNEGLLAEIDCGKNTIKYAHDTVEGKGLVYTITPISTLKNNQLETKHWFWW